MLKGVKTTFMIIEEFFHYNKHNYNYIHLDNKGNYIEDIEDYICSYL